MSYVIAAGAAISIGGSLMQGDQAKQSGKIQNIFAQSQARIEEFQALETAKIIRRAGKKAVGAANSAYAGAGVKLGEGSAADVEQEIVSGVEHDAFQAILEGSGRARGARQAGEIALQQGRDANAAAMNQAAGTALMAYGKKNPGGWKTQTQQVG